MEGSPAKKQKQTTPMAITPPPLKRSYAAVVRSNSGCGSNNNSDNKNNNHATSPVVAERRPIIIVEAGTGLGKAAKAAKTSAPVIGEDVHPYLRQLEQALELEVKYRVPVGDNPGGEMSGGITSGMRDGSAHVLRCLKVNIC